ncbi:hypothetical protein M422DRAFT_243691 [Sphaerobolus stellatus SS14]|nr:hypothetical protein M422DRAFT_243691 [Sphaerobolus stellatus SS14]
MLLSTPRTIPPLSSVSTPTTRPISILTSALRPSYQPSSTHTHNIEMDLSLLGTDVFSDAAVAFAWDGQGSLDWSLGLGNDAIGGTADGNAGGEYGGYGGGGMGM